MFGMCVFFTFVYTLYVVFCLLFVSYMCVCTCARVCVKKNLHDGVHI